MNRRDFIKQSAVVAAGIATGAKVLPVALSEFPGVVGVDVAQPGSDQTIIYLGYSDQLKTHIWKQGSVELDLMGLYIKNIAMAMAVPVELLKDSGCSRTYSLQVS